MARMCGLDGARRCAEVTWRACTSAAHPRRVRAEQGTNSGTVPDASRRRVSQAATARPTVDLGTPSALAISRTERPSERTAPTEIADRLLLRCRGVDGCQQP